MAFRPVITRMNNTPSAFAQDGLPAATTKLPAMRNVPDGGGWRARGRSENVKGRGIGYDYVHVAFDDHTRVGYVEVLPR